VVWAAWAAGTALSGRICDRGSCRPHASAARHPAVRQAGFRHRGRSGSTFLFFANFGFFFRSPCNTCQLVLGYSPLGKRRSALVPLAVPILVLGANAASVSPQESACERRLALRTVSHRGRPVSACACLDAKLVLSRVCMAPSSSSSAGIGLCVAPTDVGDHGARWPDEKQGRRVGPSTDTTREGRCRDWHRPSPAPLVPAPLQQCAPSRASPGLPPNRFEARPLESLAQALAVRRGKIGPQGRPVAQLAESAFLQSMHLSLADTVRDHPLSQRSSFVAIWAPPAATGPAVPPSCSDLTSTLVNPERGRNSGRPDDRSSRSWREVPRLVIAGKHRPVKPPTDCRKPRTTTTWVSTTATRVLVDAHRAHCSIGAVRSTRIRGPTSAVAPRPNSRASSAPASSLATVGRLAGRSGCYR